MKLREACDAALQANFRQHDESARLVSADNRDEDQCVCTEQDDKSGDADLHKILKGAEQWYAFASIPIYSTTPLSDGSGYCYHAMLNYKALRKSVCRTQLLNYLYDEMRSSCTRS